MFIRYGGPDSSMVKDMFNTDFNTFMVANKSIIGVSIDGRGSNLMGLRARYSIYKKLGVVEVDDQLAVIRYSYLKIHPRITPPSEAKLWQNNRSSERSPPPASKSYESRQCKIFIHLINYIFYTLVTHER